MNKLLPMFCKLNFNLKTLLIALLLFAWTGVYAQISKSEIQAHRGGAGLYPENTLIAMLNSAALGINILELDVHITADGKVVLSHDPYFTPDKALTFGGDLIEKGGKMRHVIYKMDYNKVKQYDVGLLPQKKFPTRVNVGAEVPLLSEIFSRVEEYTTRFNLPAMRYSIEIKSHPFKDDRLAPRFEKFTELVMGVIRRAGVQDRVIIQSFDVRTLEYLHKFYPEVTLSYLVPKKGSFEKDMRKISFIPDIYSPEYRKVNQKMVDTAHRLGMKVIPWTVNKRSNFMYMLQVGVDGIITDYPNRALNWAAQ